MQRVIVATLVWAAAVWVQAGEVIHVKAGEALTLDASRSEWRLDELVLEDGATLQVPASLGQVQIDARSARFGKDSRILASGIDAAAGPAGADGVAATELCKDGGAGTAGAQGAAGGDGVTLTLNLAIAALESVTLDTRGGAGGSGGAGGAGGAGGNFDSCSAPQGGDGGVGGDGGDGGGGGQVRLTYSLLPGSGIDGGIGNRIQVLAAGGKAGAGGAGGKGGAGVEGRFVNMKTLTGSKKWMAGGKSGSDGPSGKPGRDGARGQILMQQDLGGRVEELARNQAAQVAAMDTLLAEKLAQEKAQAQAAAVQSLQGVNQEIALLKEAVAGLAAKDQVQQQGQQLEATTARLTQALQALQKRVEQLEQQMKKPVSPGKMPAPAAP